MGMAVLAWFVCLLIVALQPRMLGLIVSQQLRYLLRRGHRRRKILLSQAHAMEGDKATVGNERGKSTTILSATVRTVSLFSLSLGGIEVQRSDGAVASIRMISLSRRRQEATTGRAHAENRQARPILLRIDGAIVILPCSGARSTPAVSPRRSARNAAKEDVDCGNRAPSEIAGGAEKKPIALPAVVLWGMRLVALEMGDMRAEVRAAPAAPVPACSDEILPPKAPDLGETPAANTVRSIELSGLRVSASFSTRRSRLSVSPSTLLGTESVISVIYRV